MPKAFTPTDISTHKPTIFSRRTASPTASALPHQNDADDIGDNTYRQWLPSLQHPAAFPEEIFIKTMNDMILNPNHNSSLLLRADILWDSDSNGNDSTEGNSISVVKDEQGKEQDGEGEDAMPYGLDVKEYTLARKLVRRFVPRNPGLDRYLLQTCLFYRQDKISPQQGDGEEDHENEAEGEEDNERYEEGSLVIYLPHAPTAEEIPFYHPPVEGIAFLHRRRQGSEIGNLQTQGSTDEDAIDNRYILEIHHLTFPESSITSPSAIIRNTPPRTNPARLSRTLHHLLHKLHKHSTGTYTGYVKRIHHDIILPKESVQDTYLSLKSRHAKRLIDNWVESTDPRKHVFEDLLIASWLIVLWRERYIFLGQDEGGNGGSDEVKGSGKMKGKRKGWEGNKRPWKGFVDVGCGNGVLVDILRREGFQGWGFDARKRKSWEFLLSAHDSPVYPNELEDPLPWLREMLLIPHTLPHPTTLTEGNTIGGVPIHNGIFPNHTFIISNHADQLTGWTPLLATLSDSPFLAIPCCAYNLSADKFRPAATAGWVREKLALEKLGKEKGGEEEKQPQGGKVGGKSGSGGESTYSGLVTWVEGLSEQVGWKVEKEVLRIPSTRNIGILGWDLDQENRKESETEEMVLRVISREGGGVGWVDKVASLMKPGRKEGH